MKYKGQPVPMHLSLYAHVCMYVYIYHLVDKAFTRFR